MTWEFPLINAEGNGPKVIGWLLDSNGSPYE
jgi:hypothetical protein